MNGIKKLIPYYVILALFLFTVAFPPLFHLFNRADIWILGMPLVLIWIMVVSYAWCVALFIRWYRDRGKEEK